MVEMLFSCFIHTRTNVFGGFKTFGTGACLMFAGIKKLYDSAAFKTVPAAMHLWQRPYRCSKLSWKPLHATSFNVTFWAT